MAFANISFPLNFPRSNKLKTPIMKILATCQFCLLTLAEVGCLINLGLTETTTEFKLHKHLSWKTRSVYVHFNKYV